MICTSIQNKNLEEIFSILERDDIEMAEIRLDLCPELDDEDIQSLFSGTDVPLVATCRIAGSADMREAERRLKVAIEAGAKYVDLELEAPAPMGKRIRRAARDCGTTLIRSYHDYEGTPDMETLREMVTKCRIFGSDIIKVATFAHDACRKKAHWLPSVWERLAGSPDWTASGRAPRSLTRRWMRPKPLRPASGPPPR